MLVYTLPDATVPPNAAPDDKEREDLYSNSHSSMYVYVRLPGYYPQARLRVHTHMTRLEAGRGDLPPGHGLHLLLPPLLDSLHLSGKRLTRIYIGDTML